MKFNIRDNIKRLVGGYIIGFQIASDGMANAAKSGMKTLHSTACQVTPILLTNKVIQRFERARDMLMLKIHKHAICTHCDGKGYLVVMSVSGEPVGQVACPQCTLKGYLRMTGQREDFAEVTPTQPMPVDSAKKETAVRVFDRIMDTARTEKTLPVIYCRQCKGQRLTHVRDKSGRYEGQKRCPVCDGTGRDYKAMAAEVMKTCLKEHIAKGYSKDEAWEMCMKACFKQETETS